MTSRITALALLAGVSLMPAEKRIARAPEPLNMVLARIPEKARVKRNPFRNDSQASAAGKKLFAQHCAECHGESGAGTRKGPNLRTTEFQHAKPGEIFWILTNGVVRRGMPAWSKLPEPQRWQLVTFLGQLARSSGGKGATDQLRELVHNPGLQMSCNTAWRLFVPYQLAIPARLSYKIGA